MSDILSQDQIDALLNSQGFGGDDDGGSANDPDILYKALLKVFNLFCEEAGTVISTVFNRQATFSAELCEKASHDTLKEKLPTVCICLKINLKSEVEGSFYLILEKKNVAVLSDLMMMGDGTAEYNEDHKDAVSELFNQVMGAFTTSLGSNFETNVTVDTIEVLEFEADNPPFDISSQNMILVSEKVEGMADACIGLLIPEEVSNQLVKNVPVSKDEDGDAGDVTGNVGLNMSEIDDLSKVTSFSDSEGQGEGKFSDSASSSVSAASQQNIDMLLDVELDVGIELGNSILSIKRILDLAPGSIIEMDRMAGEPVDLLVNNKVVAKGEVVVIDENFGIRIVSLVSPEERIRSLR